MPRNGSRPRPSTPELRPRQRALEKSGHLARGHDPADRRRLLVRLTAKGRRAWEATIDEQAATEHALLAALTESERERLSSLLRKVVTAAERHEPPLMPPVEGLTDRPPPR